jgi:hypothetical protein
MYCSSATVCTWTYISGSLIQYTAAFGTYAYLQGPPPTVSTPWVLAIDRDPIAGTWRPSHTSTAYTYGGGTLVGTVVSDSVYFSTNTAGMGVYWTSCECARCGGARAEADAGASAVPSSRAAPRSLAALYPSARRLAAPRARGL